MMIRSGLASVVAGVVWGASLGVLPAMFRIPFRPTAHTIHLPLHYSLLLLPLPLLHPLLLLRVQPIRERDQRMDQPYDVLGPRQGTSDFHSLPSREAASVVSSVCGKYSNF
ncbi:hypothetical protein YC2023_032916 [Brassica napus]